MNPKAYTISMLTAAAIAGAGAGQIINGLDAKAAVVYTDKATVTIPLGAAAKSTIADFATNRVCPVYDARFELTGGDVCTAAEVSEIRIGRNAAGELYATAVVAKTWTKTPGSPQ